MKRAAFLPLVLVAACGFFRHIEHAATDLSKDARAREHVTSAIGEIVDAVKPHAINAATYGGPVLLAWLTHALHRRRKAKRKSAPIAGPPKT